MRYEEVSCLTVLMLGSSLTWHQIVKYLKRHAFDLLHTEKKVTVLLRK